MNFELSLRTKIRYLKVYKLRLKQKQKHNSRYNRISDGWGILKGIVRANKIKLVKTSTNKMKKKKKEVVWAVFKM